MAISKRLALMTLVVTAHSYRKTTSGLRITLNPDVLFHVSCILVLAGTVMAFLNFGYPAIGYITFKQDICVAALALATIAGAVIQLWLLPEINARFASAGKAQKTKVKKVKAGKGNAVEKPKTATWRTA